MIKNHLSRILGERRWSQAKLAKVTGIRPSTINEIYHDIAERVNLDHIDKICEALNCTMDELFEYIPNKHKRTGEDLIIEEHGNFKEKSHTR